MPQNRTCSYCDREMDPGAALQSDPTIHQRCAEMREYDNLIGTKMSGLPPHLADIAPAQQCDRCERKTWTQTAFGTVCNFPQPDGSRCSGRFRTF